MSSGSCFTGSTQLNVVADLVMVSGRSAMSKAQLVITAVVRGTVNQQPELKCQA
jgi:hypothetical protein